MPISGHKNPSSPTPGREANEDAISENGQAAEDSDQSEQISSSRSAQQKKRKVVAVSLSDEEFNEIFDAVLDRVQKEDEDTVDDLVADKATADANGKIDNKNEDEEMEDSHSDREELADNQEEDSDNDENQELEDDNLQDAGDDHDDVLQDDLMAGFRDLQTPTFEDDDKDFQCMTPPRLSHRRSKAVKRRRKNDGKQPNHSKKLKVKTKSTTCLKGPSCKKKRLQQRSVEELGVWVQCMNRTCMKWRYLTDITDPSHVPEVWMCEMNKDSLYNKCEALEQDYQSLEFVFNRFTEGSIVWAKMGGYPWWPAMVEEDPDTGTYMELDESNHTPVLYHVVFLDQNITRAWVNSSCLKKFENDKSSVERAFAKKRNYSSQIEKAKARAREALTLSIPERVKKFGFSHNFKGAIIEDSQCTDSHDSAELKVSGLPSSNSHFSKSSASAGKSSQSSVDEILDQTEAMLDEAQEALTNLDKCSSQQDSAELKVLPSSNSCVTKPSDNARRQSQSSVDEILDQTEALLDEAQEALTNLDKCSSQQDSICKEKGDSKGKISKEEKKRIKQEKKERKARKKEEKRKLKELAKDERNRLLKECKNEVTEEARLEKQTNKEEKKILKEQAKVDKKEREEEKKILKEKAKIEKQERKEKEKEEKKKLKGKNKLEKQELKSREKEEKKIMKEKEKLEKKNKLAEEREEKKLLDKLSKLDDQEKKKESKKEEKEKRKEEKRKLKEQKKLDKKKQKEERKKLKNEVQGNEAHPSQKRKLDERTDVENKEDQPVHKKRKENGSISNKFRGNTKTDLPYRRPSNKNADKVKPSFKPPSKVVPTFGTGKRKGGFKPPMSSDPKKADENIHNKGQQKEKAQKASNDMSDQKTNGSLNNQNGQGESKDSGKSTKMISNENEEKIKEDDCSVVKDEKKPKVSKKSKFSVKRQTSLSCGESNDACSSKAKECPQSSGSKDTSSQDKPEPNSQRSIKQSVEEVQIKMKANAAKVAEADNSTGSPSVPKKDNEKSEDLDNDSEDFCLDMNWPEDPTNDLEPESISEKVQQLLENNSQSDSQPFDLVEE